MAKAVDIPKVREDANHKKRENLKTQMVAERTALNKTQGEKRIWQR